MRSASQPPRNSRAAPTLLLVAALVGLFLVGLPGLAPASALPTATPGPVVTSVSGSTTVNGYATVGATSVGSALQVTANQPLVIQFSYAAHGGGLGVPVQVAVTSATLSLQLLGATGSTWTVVVSNPQPEFSGNLTLITDLSGYRYLVAGVYAMVAAIHAANGTLWSEGFYLRITAPYDVVGTTVAAGALAVYELYNVLSLATARQVRRRVTALRRAQRDGAEPVKPPGGSLSGIIVGLSLVFLAQQVGRISLSDLWMGLEYLLVGALVSAVLLGFLARELNRRNDRLARKEVPAEAPAPSEEPGSAGPADTAAPRDEPTTADPTPPP